ncbi:MAG: Ig-like domain-containing protein [Oscillospiraceae bacterium]|nr:Ig-like domain-containing protein [Oscillospiraceae bacterium]
MVLIAMTLATPFAAVIPQTAFAAASTVTRSFSSATPTAGIPLTVSLAVSVSPPDTFYAIDEIVPTGWTVTAASSGGDFTTTPGHVFWTVFSGAVSTTHSYTVTVPANASGISVFSGTYAFDTTPGGQILGATSVNVQSAAQVLTSITVTPANPSVVVAATQQFTATAFDQNGLAMVTQPTFTWTSGTPATGTIDAATGLFTAVAVGTSTITATSGAVSGNTLATVIASLPTFTITPTSGANGMIMPMVPTTVASGGSQTFTITANPTYQIADVLVDGVSVGAVGTYTFNNVLANHTISASFSLIPTGPFTITSSAGANGSISPLGANSFASGTNQTYTITPNPGYQIADVLVDSVSVGAVGTYTFNNIQATHTIVATFTVIPVLTSITVSPASVAVLAGATQQFTAVAKDQNGVALVTQPTFTWTSSNNAIATIDAAGLATGVVAGGPVVITATSGAVSGTASLTVNPVPVLTSVTVAPATATILVAGTQQLTASPLDQNSAPFVGATVTWSSSDSAIASVNATTGLVTGISAGVATITATAVSGATTVTGTSSITVNAVPVLTTITISPANPTIITGATQQFTATGLDQNGVALVTQPTFTWASGTPATGTIDAATGLFTAVAVGTSTITATSGAVSGNTLATVSAPAPVLTSVTVAPATATILVAGTQQLTASPLDQNLAPFVGATITWSSSDNTKATVDVNGLVTGVAAGSATITATAVSGAITVTGTSQITVNTPPPVLTSVTVNPPTPAIAVGATQQLTANPLDQNLGAFVGATITWNSSDNAIATVDVNGLVTGVAAGSATITATAVSGAITVTGTSLVTVSAAPPTLVLTSVTVSPATASINVGATQQLTANPLDQNLGAFAGATITWSSSNSAIASVDATTGLVTGVAGGSAIITATAVSGAITVTGTSSITVNVVPVLTSVTVAPATATILVAGTQQLTASPLDQNLTAFVGATVTWSSNNSAIASVNATTGLVTGVAAGSATITATAVSGAVTVTGTSQITVNTPPPVFTSITINPSSATINVGGNSQFTATALDQNGVAMVNQPAFTWTSSNTTVGTVDVNGLVSALSAGTTTITATSGAISGTAAVTVSTPSSILAVTQISAIQTSAIPDNTYADGWKWVFNVTAPSNETQLTMKFADWLSGSNTIPAANNIQFFSAQSSNASSEVTAIPITAANTYSGVMNLVGDMDAVAPGRQIQITVEARVPSGSAGGSYSTSYGIHTGTGAI